jgi:hypothetical protein
VNIRYNIRIHQYNNVSLPLLVLILLVHVLYDTTIVYKILFIILISYAYSVHCYEVYVREKKNRFKSVFVFCLILYIYDSLAMLKIKCIQKKLKVACFFYFLLDQGIQK